MDKVLVFTSEEKWGNLQDNIQERVSWDIYPNEKQPITECVVNSNKKVELCPVKELAHAGIYLVYDSINMLQLKPLLDNCPNDNIYILIHNLGRKEEDFAPWKDHCYILKGKHENYAEELYLPVFEIITDDEGDKLQRIVKSIFMPIEEAVTELLHECHVPQKNLAESNSYRILYRKEEFKKDLDEFKKKYEASDSFDEYKEDLGKLRDLVFGHRQQST